jgi:Uma2 family endonuclease
VSGRPSLKRRATYADLLKVPDRFVAEIIHGKLYTTPRPAPRHARAETSLAAALFGPFENGLGGPGGWWILIEPELHLLGGDEVLVPDLAGWRTERMPSLPESAFFETVPDWICEILSPSTAALDRSEKLPLYAEAGVGHAWLVDPLLQTLEVLRRERASWLLVTTFQGERAVRAEPFDAVELDLARIFRTRTEE